MRRRAPAAGSSGSGGAPVCLDSFSPVASIATGTCRYDGLRQPRRRCRKIWRGVDASRSAPRTTSVIALQRVVDDDRELIGEEAVGAPDDEVADIAREVLRLRALQPVAELDACVADAHAPRARGRAAPRRRDAVAAGARVDALAAGTDGRRFSSRRVHAQA